MDKEVRVGAPLIQDGGTGAAIIRIVTIDIQTGATVEYAYALSNLGTATNPRYGTVSDIVAINAHKFLVDERDGQGLGDGSTAAVKKLYQIDLKDAEDVSGISGAMNPAGLRTPGDPSAFSTMRG